MSQSLSRRQRAFFTTRYIPVRRKEAKFTITTSLLNFRVRCRLGITCDNPPLIDVALGIRAIKDITVAWPYRSHNIQTQMTQIVHDTVTVTIVLLMTRLCVQLFKTSHHSSIAAY